MNKPLNVYITSSWVGRDSLIDYVKILTKNNFNVRSSWIKRESGNDRPEILSKDGYYDLKELEESQVLLAFMISPNFAYRRIFCQIGYALGQNKKIIIICPGKLKRETYNKCKYDFYCMRQPFFWHPNIIKVMNFEEALDILETFRKK
jgi:hypothetical protein